MEMKPVPTGRPGVRLVDEQGVGAVIVPGEFDTSPLQGWTEDPFDRGKRSPVSVFTTSMVVMTGGPGDLGQTIALRPDTPNPDRRQQRHDETLQEQNCGPLHCTAPQKAARPRARKARKPASAGELSHEAGPFGAVIKPGQGPGGEVSLSTVVLLSVTGHSRSRLARCVSRESGIAWHKTTHHQKERAMLSR